MITASRPAASWALDMARIEAGLFMLDVDYPPQSRLDRSQKSSPFEMGLGWTVSLDKPGYFIGRRALGRAARGSAWGFVGLEVDWQGLEKSTARRPAAADSGHGRGGSLPVTATAGRSATPRAAAGRRCSRSTRARAPGAAALRAGHARRDRGHRGAQALCAGKRWPPYDRVVEDEAPRIAIRGVDRMRAMNAKQLRRHRHRRRAQRPDAAAYLARAGRRCWCSSADRSAARPYREVFPGFKFSVCSYVVSLLRPEIIRELDLPRHGLEILPLRHRHADAERRLPVARGRPRQDAPRDLPPLAARRRGATTSTRA